MANFDIDSYFDSRITADALNTGGGANTASKYDEVLAASQAKVKALTELRQQQELNKASLVGEYSQGGFLDTAVSTGANLVTLAGEGLAGALEMHNDANETDPIKAAQTRLAAKKIRDTLNMDSLVGINPDTGERTSSLQRRVLGNAAVLATQGSAAAVQGAVGLVSLASGGRFGQWAKEQGFRPDDGVAALEEFLTPEMRAVNQTVEAADGFGATIGAMVDNPSSITAGITKSVPSMLLGGAIGKGFGLVKGIGSGLAGAMGEGTIMAGSAAEGIRSQTDDGRLNLKQSLLAAGVGVMGAGVGFAGNKLAGALRIGDLDEALVTGALAKSPRDKLTSSLLSAGVEGGEELLQSTGETIAQNLALGKPFDEGVGDAAAMGLMTGAPMGAMSGLVSGAENSRKVKADSEAQFAAATTANDPSVYVDPQSPQYSPSAALKVWLGHAELNTTTPEVKTENLKKSNDLLTSLEDAYTHATTVRNVVKANAEQTVAFKARVEILKAELSDTNLLNDGSKSIKAAELAAIEQGLAVPKNILATQRQQSVVARLANELNESLNVHEQLSDLVKEKTDVKTVAGDLAMAKAPVDPLNQPAVQASQAAAERLINLSMVSNEYLNQEEASSLAEDTKNGLSEPQRTYLRQFSAARLAQNELETADSVANTILVGDNKGNYGLKQYKRFISQALDSGDKATAVRYMDKLQDFASDHSQKAKVVADAMIQAIKQGKSLQVIREQGVGGIWALAREGTKYRQSQVTDMGGFVAHPNSAGSAKLAARMTPEAAVLNQALAEHIAAYQLKFGEAPKGILLPKATTPVAAVNTSPAPVQKTEKSIQVTPAPVAQTPAAPTSVAPVVTPIPVIPSTKKETNGSQTSQAQQTEAQGQEPAGAVAAGPVTKAATIAKANEEKALQKEIALIEKEIKRAEKLIKRTGRLNPQSLWTAIKHSLNESSLADIYGTEWKKRYSLLKGKPGGSLSDLVASGALDAFLPYDMRQASLEESSNLEDAEETIKELLRQGNYLTYETQELMAQLGLEVQALEEALSLLDITQEIDHAETEITQDNKAPAEQNTSAPSEKPTGSTAASAGKEEATTGTEQAVKVQKSEGVLSIFSQYVKDASNKLQDSFRTTNLVAQFFTQSGVSESNVSNRPLVAVKDFLTAWTKEEVKPEDFLKMKEGEQLTEKEKTALKHFQKLMKAWLPAITEGLAVRAKPANNKPDDYIAQDMLQYLYTDANTPVVEQNVVLAIGQAAYLYMVDAVNSPMYLKTKEIVDMHGYAENSPIDFGGEKELSKINNFKVTTIADLGKKAVQALGFKARDNAPLDLMPKLEIALGVQALELLRVRGYISIETVSTMLVEAYFDPEANNIAELKANLAEVAKKSEAGKAFGKEYPKAYQDNSYVVINYATQDNKQVLTKQAQSIKEANKGSSNVIDKLFGVDHAPRLPSLEPQDFKQLKAKKTIQDLPKKLWQAIQNSMRKPHTANLWMVDVALGLGRKDLAKVAGAKNTDQGMYHSTNVSSIDAQNDNLDNQIDQMFELFERDGYNAVWYSVGEVWKNFRAGIANQAMNLQSSKVHRAIFKQASWTVTIAPKKEPELLKEFMISVAMGLGEKTDQQRNSKSLDKYFTVTSGGLYLFKNEKVMAAALALQEVMLSEKAQDKRDGNEWPQETKDLILAATQKEGMMSLQALVAYAQYLTAQAEQKESFEFTLLTGADGKTNGPMLTLLALGAADFATLNRGGMYQEGEANHFSEWFENDEAQDLYQDTGKTTVGLIEKSVAITAKWSEDYYRKKVANPYKDKFKYTPIHATYKAALEEITGKLTSGTKVTSVMRNLVKTPLTAFFFGSAASSAVYSMENAFIKGFYTKIEALKAEEQKTGTPNPEAFKRFVDATNALLDLGHISISKSTSGRGKPEYLVATLKDAMVTELTKEQEKALRVAFQIVMGNAVKTTLTTNFAAFGVIRNTMNTTVQAAWNTYHAAYKAARAQELEKLMESGVVASRMVNKKVNGEFVPTGVREPLHDLNADQLKVVKLKVKHMLPILNSAYSKEEGNINVGLQMGKQRATQSTELFYNNANTIKKRSQDGSYSIKQETNRSAVKEEIDPGVTPTSFSIHSLDSAIMHEALLEFENSLNVHDELATSVKDMAPAATAINKAVVDKLLNYSPMRESLNMLQRMILGMAQGVAQKNINKDTVATMFKAWADAYNRSLFEDDKVAASDIGLPLLMSAFDTANSSDKVRLENISKLFVVDQYTWEGGQYNVPQKVRDAATQLLSELPKEVDPKVLAALEMLTKFAATGNVIESDVNFADLVPEAPVELPTLEDMGIAGVVTQAVVDLVAKANPEFAKAATTMPVEAALNSLTPLQRANAVQSIMAAKAKLANTTPWGELGKSQVEPEADLVGMFGKQDKVTVQAAIAVLAQRYDTKGTLHSFYGALLKRIAMVVPKDLTIQTIRKDTATSDVLPEALTVTKSRGWYTVGNTGKAIYVLSPEFVHSGLTAELLLHELLHAALSSVIASTRNGNATAAAKTLVAELQTLLDKAKEQDTQNKFGAVFNSPYPIDELVSWGMTNAKFQQDILMKVEMDKAVKKSGMSLFLDSITKFFFRNGDSKKNAKTGMASLLASVSGLLEEAAKTVPQEPINLTMAAQIDAFNTLEIHEALDEGKVTPAFNTHLKGIINTIVDKLHGPANAFKDAIAKGVASTPGDVFNEAIATGVAPFTSELQASGFMFNNQTFFVAEQVEATVKALLDSKDNKMAAVREELRKLEAEVRGKLKPQDFFEGNWALATKAEQNQATALHSYLFKNVNGDYLARFAALGLSHEGFNALLKIPTKLAPVTQQDRSIEGNLTRLFSKLLNSINGKFITHTREGQPADDKLAALVRQLVEIENRNKNTLKSPLGGILDFADNRTKAARQGGKDVLSNILNSGMFMKSKNVTVAAASSVVGIIANNQVRHLFQNAITLRNSVYKEPLGVVASAIAEMNGPPRALIKLLREGKAHLEGGRKDIIAMTKASVLESFKDGGKYLSDVQKKAVTSVLLRTGAHVLLDTFDMQQLASLVTDQAVLDKAIATEKAKLSGLGNNIDQRLIKDSKALAYHLVTNRSKIADVKMNAHNIAHLYLTVYQGQLTEAQTTALIPTIDALVSLYALSYTSTTSKTALGTVLAVENARTDGNGVQMALLTQKNKEKLSLSRLFHDSPVLMAKGYIPEIYNPHTDIRAATEAEGKVLMNLGYKLVSSLSLDPNDPFRDPRSLYVMRNGGMLPWLSGLFSFTNMRAKGTQHHGENAKGTQAVLARNAGTGRVAAGEGDAFDPTKETTDYMTPTLNPSGGAVNYRYMMHTETKDGLLERENRFDEVLGALAGSVFDKEESAVHNKKAVEMLYADFKEGFTRKSTVYLEVSATSTDPELREIWRMLPKSTQDAVKQVWGKEAMLVRPENLDIAFGYRKLSISSRFSKDVMDQTTLDKAMIGFVTLIMKTYGRTIKGMTTDEANQFAMSNAVTVRRLESMVQEIMHEVKDIYVVKNVITSLNNIKSNLSLLLLYGVNPIKGLRDMRIAWVGAEEHQRDSAALFKLQQQLDTGYITGDTSEIEAEIKRLEEALRNNPVAKVIEMGMMPSIVEDVSTEEDPYTYKAALAMRMDKYKAKINPKVLAVAKNVVITKDTKIYKSLSRVVQLSDFVAKYALYQHLTTRETDPMTEEAAAHAASEAFINYDVPMHRGLEYMDSVGAFMFTKYFLRVQRVIRGRIKHAPGKLLMLLAAESFLGDLPTIMDASIILRAGNNPLQTGPLELLEAIPQLPTLFWLPGR